MSTPPSGQRISSVDGRFVKRVDQSPGYPMQLMLSIYEFRADDGNDRGRYPKEFQVDYVRVHAPPLTARAR